MDQVEIGPVAMEEDEDFELKSDDENIFDFANFNEQSLKLFTPYEQNFFGSLDIPTLIEITKVHKELIFIDNNFLSLSLQILGS